MEYFRVNTECYVDGVYMKRVARKPPRWMCENEQGIKFVLEKSARGQRGWTVLLPAGGFITLPTRLKAIKFMNELVRVDENPVDSGPIL